MHGVTFLAYPINEKLLKIPERNLRSLGQRSFSFMAPSTVSIQIAAKRLPVCPGLPVESEGAGKRRSECVADAGLGDTLQRQLGHAVDVMTSLLLWLNLPQLRCTLVRQCSSNRRSAMQMNTTMSHRFTLLHASKNNNKTTTTKTTNKQQQQQQQQQQQMPAAYVQVFRSVQRPFV